MLKAPAAIDVNHASFPLELRCKKAKVCLLMPHIQQSTNNNFMNNLAGELCWNAIKSGDFLGKWSVEWCGNFNSTNSIECRLFRWPWFADECTVCVCAGVSVKQSEILTHWLRNKSVQVSGPKAQQRQQGRANGTPQHFRTSNIEKSEKRGINDRNQ